MHRIIDRFSISELQSNQNFRVKNPDMFAFSCQVKRDSISVILEFLTIFLAGI